MMSNNIISQKTAFNSSQQTIKETQREPIKHLLIDSPKSVKGIIHYFYAIVYAEVGDWSPFSPCANNPDEVMSILVRKIKVQ